MASPNMNDYSSIHVRNEQNGWYLVIYNFWKLFLVYFFLLKIEMLLLFIWHIPLTFFTNNWELPLASTAGYVMTIINKLNSFTGPPPMHVIKSDVPAPQLPLAWLGVGQKQCIPNRLSTLLCLKQFDCIHDIPRHSTVSWMLTFYSQVTIKVKKWKNRTVLINLEGQQITITVNYS